MTTRNTDRRDADPGRDAAAPQPDRRVLAVARALGRYQALLDMAAERAADPDREDDADLRAWPTGPAKPRVIDLYGLRPPAGFLPGFMAYASAPTADLGSFFRR